MYSLILGNLANGLINLLKSQACLFGEEFKFRGIPSLKVAAKENLRMSCLSTVTLCSDCLCYCGDPMGLGGLRYNHPKLQALIRTDLSGKGSIISKRVLLNNEF